MIDTKAQFEERLRKQAEKLGIPVEELRKQIHNNVKELLLLEEKEKKEEE